MPKTEPVRVDDGGVGQARMGDDVGNEPALPEPGIGEEKRAHDRQRRPQRAARGFQQQQDAQGADPDLHRRRQARPRGERQFPREEEDVEGAARAGDRQNPVGQGHPVARRGFQRGIGEEGEQDREAQVHRPRLRGIQDRDHAAEPELRLRDPELEHRPQERRRGDEQGHRPAARRPPAGIGAVDEVLQLGIGEVAARLGRVRIGHRTLPCQKGPPRRLRGGPDQASRRAPITRSGRPRGNTSRRPRAAGPTGRPAPFPSDRGWRRPGAARGTRRCPRTPP